MGIAYKSRLDVTADLKAGRLRLLLPDVMGEEVPLQLVCMHRSQVTPVVICLRDYLRAQYEQLCETQA
jgi:DNA-binding transcriptional LysR family regulator